MNKRAAIDATLILFCSLLVIAAAIGVGAGLVYLFGPIAVVWVVCGLLLCGVWFGIYVDVTERTKRIHRN